MTRRFRSPNPRLLPETLLTEVEYDPERGAFRWIKEGKNRREGWFTARELSPVSKRLTIGGYQAARVAWFLQTGEDPGEKNLVVDHKDADSLNNEWSNLRLCTNSENNLNKKSHASSGERFIYTGSWKGYLVNLCCEGGYLGYFHTLEEAKAARDAHPKWALSKEIRSAHAKI